MNALSTAIAAAIKRNDKAYLSQLKQAFNQQIKAVYVPDKTVKSR